MRVRPHVTSILFVAAAVGVSVYAYLDRGSITDPERALRTRNVFPAFRRDEVTKIEITRGAETLTLERQGEADKDAEAPSWRMLSPTAAKVDPAAVDALLATLDYAGFVRKMPSRGPQFDPVRAQGTLRMGRVSYHFTLGAPAPGGPEGAAYFDLDGEGPMVVTHELASALVAPADGLRDKTVVPYLSIQLAALEVRGPTDRYVMQRIDDTSFRFQDTSRRVSREAIDKVWGAFAELRAESFLDEAEGARLTQKPVFTVVMTPTDHALPPGELVVGDACPGHPEDVVVVRRSPEPLAACAPHGILGGLSTPRTELDDGRLFAARPDEVEAVRLESLPGGLTVDIARKGTGWHERAPIDRDLESDEAALTTAWVQSLTKAEGRVLDHGPATFSPRVRATVTRADGHVEEIAEVAPGELGHGVARRKQDGAFVDLAHDVARLLEPRKSALRGRTLWNPPAEGAWVEAVTAHCPGVDEELTRTDRGFLLVRPKGLPADTPATLDLADLVMRARAERFVADADDGTFGFGACSVAVTVRQEGGSRRLALDLGSHATEGEGTLYARAEGDPAVFTILPGVAEMTKAVLVDRDVFFRDRASVARVTVVRRGRAPVVFERQGETLAPRGPLPAASASDAAPPDGGALPPGEAILDVLSHVRAARVEHLGPALLTEALAPAELDLRVEIAADGGAKNLRMVVGALTEDKKGRYARAEGVDATYVVSAELLAPLFALP